MHRNNQNNHYRSYSYLPLSTSTYSEGNTHHPYYDSRLPTQQSFYSNTTPIVRYASLRYRQQYQPSTTISDLVEPLSVFDEQTFPRHYRSNLISFPSVYVPSNPILRRSVSDARLTSASFMRKRLLIDIQHNISEIDEELSLFERRPSIPRHIPPRLSSINKKTHSSNNENQMRSNKPKRIYEVIPRITNESKTTSQQSIEKLADRSMSHLYIGQYHYAAEIEEMEIGENDPENSDLKSTIGEIPRLSFHETLSLDQFRREQSALLQNRALIFVPEYRDNAKIEFNKTAEDSHQNDPTDTNIAQSSTVRSLQDVASANKLNIQTAPKPKIDISSPATRNLNGFSYMIETDLINTMLSKPVKYTGASTIMVTNIQEELSSSQQTIISPTSSGKDDMDDNTAYFFSDVENDCDTVEAHIPVNRRHLALQTELEIIADNINNGLDDEHELQNTSTFLYFV